MGFSFAICNEIFQGAPLDQVCQTAKRLGYDGIELAPHTLAEDATKLSADARAQIRAQIADAGLKFVGIHWLLVSPPGLHVTSNDQTVRRWSWDYVRRTIDLCADLGQANLEHKGVIVFGSPKQRSAGGGMSSAQALEIFRAELARLSAAAEEMQVTILVEAIPSAETDVVNTLEEAASVVQQIGSPAVQTMFDVHNTKDERMAHEELLRKYSSFIKHVHVNEMDGSEPGMNSYNFAGLLRTLRTIHYKGWVSVEAFDFTRPADEIAKRSIECLTAGNS